MKSIKDFRASLESHIPPKDFDKPGFRALWLAAKGEWEPAHLLVRTCEDKDGCAWLHAHLHRIEGDSSNANYWYKRAGIKAYNGDIATELEEIAKLMIKSTNLKE